jgi:hypothetical protein
MLLLLLVLRASGSTKWTHTSFLTYNMLAGINAEYHHKVNVLTPIAVLSEATFVHGGLRCNR